MRTIWLLLVLVIAAGCARQVPHAEEICLGPHMSYMPYSRIGPFDGLSSKMVYLAIEASCRDFHYAMEQEHLALVIDLESVPKANCTDMCVENQGGLSSTAMYDLRIPVDFSEYDYVEKIVAYHNGALIAELPIKETPCFPGLCPGGYACIDDSIAFDTLGTCLRTDCGLPGARNGPECPAGHSCIIDDVVGNGACVKDIPVDYCEEDEDCMRQDTACDCGLGEWVNFRFYTPFPDDRPQCRCAFHDAVGVCRDNRCVGLAKELAE